MEQNHTEDERADVFDGFSSAFTSFATDAIHVGQEPEQWKSMAVVPPISLSTTFKQTGPGQHAVSKPSGPARLFKAVWGLEEDGGGEGVAVVPFEMASHVWEAEPAAPLSSNPTSALVTRSNAFVGSLLVLLPEPRRTHSSSGVPAAGIHHRAGQRLRYS